MGDSLSPLSLRCSEVQDDEHLTATVPPNPPGWADLWAFARGERHVLRRALLYLERISFSQADVPIEFLRIYYRGDRYSLYSELQG